MHLEGVRTMMARARRRVVTGVFLLGCVILGTMAPVQAKQEGDSSPVPEGEPWVIVTPVQGSEAVQSEAPGIEAVVNCVVANDWCYFQYDVTYGIGSTVVGTWRGDITLRIDGRDVSWWQTSDVTSGPAIKARHEFNCVDDNGIWPNSSCTGGWKRKWNSTYTTAKWTWPSPDIRFLEDNDTYWYDWEYEWYAAGYGTTVKWSFPRHTTSHFVCEPAPTNCHF